MIIKSILIVFIFLLNSFVFAEQGIKRSCVESSPDKIKILKETLTPMKEYSPQGKDDFIKSTLSGSILCSARYAQFTFDRNGTFKCYYHDYDDNVTVNTQGTWDVKDSKIILNFTGKQKWWSGRYTIEYYIFRYCEKIEYQYNFSIELKEDTPWAEQTLYFNFK